MREMTVGRYLQQVLVVPDAEAELQSRVVAQEVTDKKKAHTHAMPDHAWRRLTDGRWTLSMSGLWQVRLKHLEAVWRVLVAVTQVDVMADVDARYKEDLTLEEEEELRAACERVLKLDVLLPVLKDYICKHLAGVGSEVDPRRVPAQQGRG